MKDLNDLLKHAASERPPALPGHFEQSVWRSIRQRNAAEAEKETPGWLDGFLATIFNPRFALPTLAFVLFIGAGVTALDSTRPHGAVAGQSLGLQVFSGRAPALPSTLIAQRM